MPGLRLARLRGVVCLGLLWLAGACASAPPPGAGSAACWPRFPYREGWLGGDAAYSIPLSPHRSLWLFGDTFVGAPGQNDRVGAALVRNSIAISHCGPDDRFHIDYAWRASDRGGPSAWFERPGQGWWWPLGGFAWEGAVYLGLLEVEEAAERAPPLLPFRFTGTELARIRNPEADPADWEVEVLPLWPEGPAFPVASMLVHDGYAYLFAFVDRGDGQLPRILARLPLAALTAETPDLPAALETLHADGVWRGGLDADAARVLMADDASEMSVRYDAATQRFVALYNHPTFHEPFPEHPPSDAVYLRTAERVEGPWSPPYLLFRIPELARRTPEPSDPNTACYAAKEQPQFSLPGSLTFTYVCNLFAGAGDDPLAVLARLQRRMDLYRPIAASVTFPARAPEPPPRAD